MSQITDLYTEIECQVVARNDEILTCLLEDPRFYGCEYATWATEFNGCLNEMLDMAAQRLTKTTAYSTLVIKQNRLSGRGSQPCGTCKYCTVRGGVPIDITEGDYEEFYQKYKWLDHATAPSDPTIRNAKTDWQDDGGMSYGDEHVDYDDDIYHSVIKPKLGIPVPFVPVVIDPVTFEPKPLLLVAQRSMRVT